MQMYDYEMEHYQKVRELAPECMVLLKSDGSFPVARACRVALYGNGARYTVKGGTGSGDVNVHHYSTIEEGLINAGFTVMTQRWLDGYDEIRKQADKDFKAGIKQRIAEEGITAIMLGIGAVMSEPEYKLPLEGEGDIAIYVLSRVSGEGSDRSAVTGDFLLTDTEIHTIMQLQEQYAKFMLVLNVGGVVDISPISDSVSNILLLGQTGIAIGDAFADVLLGKSYPSGKLTSTWARWEDYCHKGDFGNKDDTCYREGIYVGYRYFDSVGKEPLFPFGYGLGYTSFALDCSQVWEQDGHVFTEVKVKNTGKHPGKEVVQLYVSVPEGRLDQPYQSLVAFHKTEELVPGEEQPVILSFPMNILASYDTEAACSILETGDYVLRMGASSRNTVPCAAIVLDETTVVRPLSHVGGLVDFQDWKPASHSLEIPGDIPVLHLGTSGLQKAEDVQVTADADDTAFVKTLSNGELVSFCIGGIKEEGSKSVIGNAGEQVAGAAGETTAQLVDLDVPALIMADGPAGLRLSREYGIDEDGVYAMDMGAFDEMKELLPDQMLAILGLNIEKPERAGERYYQYCVAIPTGTALAQSWNENVCETCGDMVGQEMERFGVHLWLAPALNIHRLPLCGRNFEYYSEDPYISGKMAAAVTRGVQAHPGCGVTIKHFCCNNQETNRMHSNSIVSERALREIYLKGFEIAIEEANPAAIMTSYNLLNGEHTSQRRDLCETVLRKEWGYRGVVMSDWLGTNLVHPDNKYPGAHAAEMIPAGNDIMMPGTQGDHKELLEALETGTVTRDELIRSATRVVSLARKLGHTHNALVRDM